MQDFGVRLLQDLGRRLLDAGLAPTAAALVVNAVAVAALIAVCLAAWLVTRELLKATAHRLARASRNQLDDILVRRSVFLRLSHVPPALLFYACAGILYPAGSDAAELLRRVGMSYIILAGVGAFNAALNVAADVYALHEVGRRRPVKSYVQVVQTLLYLVTAIVIVATLLDKSPWGLLTGLGAVMAVLMLVFKDSILGFVASVRLASNDMVRVGDWIQMDKYGADGDVIDVSLHTVKVQNWDKTISTIPTYALMSESFKNWRGMKESGGRRIKRAVHIDMNTVRFVDDAMLERFRRIQYIQEYLDAKCREIAAWNEEKGVDESTLVNGRHLTNVGTFRAYVEAYLRHHPMINREMTFLVRQLPPAEHGLPIEVYVFCSDTVWANYEGVQADIFDHILAVVPEFGLRVYQSPSGSDVRALASQ